MAYRNATIIEDLGLRDDALQESIYLSSIAMFANLTYEDKEAFFLLLDEYFESRPNLFSASASQQSAPSQPSRVASSTSSRTLPPINRSPAPPISPPPSANSNSFASSNSNSNNSQASKDASFAQNSHAALGHLANTNPGLAGKLISSGIRAGAGASKSGLGRLAGNQQVADALGKVGAAGLAQSARNQAGDNGNGGSGKGTPPPVPSSKKSGVSGLVSGKSFGHVDTSSKMSAFTSMWKDPQKAAAQQVSETSSGPSFAAPSRTNLPPPTRRGGSGGNAAPVQLEEAISAEGQAQVVYDYEGGDAGDLGVQENQIVNVIEKTSADWWTCEDGNGKRGLVPATYLKEI